MSVIQSKEIKIVPLTAIKLNPKNRNKHPADQVDAIVKVLRYQGFRRPVTISNRSGLLVCGEGRYLAAKKLGMTAIPATYQDYENEAQEYADGIADNALDKWADLDLAAINLDIGDLGPDFDIDVLGINGFEIDVADRGGHCDEDEVPEQVEAKAKLGDLYRLGNHRLLCGDSLNEKQVSMLIEKEKIDMVFTDPPYGVGYKYNSHDDDVTKEQHTNFLSNLIHYSLILSGKMILTPGCYNLDAVIKNSNPTHVGCWTKINAMSPGRITHFWTWEPIFFFGKWKRKRGNDVFNFPVGKQPDTGDHTCPKPINLWLDIIENFSEENEAILDFFGGSGSTLIACEKTNRKCFMMELDPHYIDVIIARWEKYTGQKAELINGK